MKFQFTRARGARRSVGVRRGGPGCFNSRAHGARDGIGSCNGACGLRFNSRAHGARDPKHASRRREARFQFTRARGARHEPDGTLYMALVSIHARTGRATLVFVAAAQSERAFQFTRARGARLVCERVRRSRVVSIHARTGRATIQQTRTPTAGKFQFTRARGARRDTPPRGGGGNSFNSRAHGARDGHCPRALVRGSSFNSRAHGARDGSRQ